MSVNTYRGKIPAFGCRLAAGFPRVSGRINVLNPFSVYYENSRTAVAIGRTGTYRAINEDELRPGEKLARDTQAHSISPLGMLERSIISNSKNMKALGKCSDEGGPAAGRFRVSCFSSGFNSWRLYWNSWFRWAIARQSGRVACIGCYWFIGLPRRVNNNSR